MTRRRLAAVAALSARSTSAILVSNNRYRLGRAVGSGTRPRLDDGMLGVAVVRVGDDRHPAFEDWTTPSLDAGDVRRPRRGVLAGVHPLGGLVARPATVDPKWAHVDHRQASSSTLEIPGVFLRVCVLARRRRRTPLRADRYETDH